VKTVDRPLAESEATLHQHQQAAVSATSAHHYTT